MSLGRKLSNGLSGGLNRIGSGVTFVAPPSTPVAPSGAAFSLIAHPEYTATDVDHLVPAGDGDAVRWVKDVVSGTWVEIATASQRPTMRAGTGGRWGWEFVRANAQYIDITAVASGLTRNRSGVTVSVCVNRTIDNTGNTQVFFFASQGTGATGSRINIREGSDHSANVFFRRTDGGTTESNNAASGFSVWPGTGWRIFTVRTDYAGAFSYPHVGGVGASDTFPGSAFSAVSAGVTSDTDSLAVRIGNHGDNTLNQYFDGIFREVHVFTSALSQSDMNALEDRMVAAAV